MRSALHALALAALLVTAGCSGGVGGDSAGPQSDTATTDPTTATVVADRLPPGLTGDGLADSDALVSAHADALAARSVTLEERHVRRYANGSLRWGLNVTVQSAANRTRLLSVTETTNRSVFGAGEGRVATFADGERVYRSVETPNSSWSDVLRTPSSDPETPQSLRFDVARTERFRVLLNAFALDDAGVVRESFKDDSRRYRVASSTLARQELLASHLNLSTVRNASLTAVVTPDGLVESVRVTYVGASAGETVRGTRTLDYSQVGETTVEAPPWYEGSVESSEASDGDSTTHSDE